MSVGSIGKLATSCDRRIIQHRVDWRYEERI